MIERTCWHVRGHKPATAEVSIQTHGAPALRASVCATCADYYEVVISATIDRGALPVTVDSIAMGDHKKRDERRAAHLMMSVLRELDDDGAVRTVEGVLKLLRGEGESRK